MKIIISPAKSLNFESPLPTQKYSESVFLDQSQTIHKALKKLTPKQLSELMSISDKLAQLNHERNQAWNTPFTPENARPAVYAFNGDVYTGLDVYSLPLDKLEELQDKLRILSGLYGILKPLDLIQPYRLEMGTKLKVNRANNLYEFWGDSITKALNEEMDKGEVLVNLASTEYFKAINVKKLNTQVVNPIFMDYKNGQLKIISFFAKKARGLMSRFIIDNQLTEVEDILGFDYEGYSYSEKETKSPDKPVFIR